MGIFGKMGGATATGAGRYFAEGQYLARVRRCAHFVSQQAGKGNGVAIEVSILRVDVGYEPRDSWIQPGVALPASNRVGEVCSTVLWIDTQAPAMGNLKAFLLAASRLDEDTIVQAFADREGVEASGYMPNRVDNQGRPVSVLDAAWDDFATTATGQGGEMLAGRTVALRASLIKTKAGNPFTKLVWSAATPDDVEQYEAAAA